MKRLTTTTIILLFAAGAFAQTPRENLQRQPGTNIVTGSLSSAPWQVPTIAALRAVTVSAMANGQVVLVSGYYAAGDGGGGFFQYDSTASGSDNLETLIKPTSGSGRWVRVQPNWQEMQGRDFLSCVHKRVIAGSTIRVVFSGDSTTEGSGLGDYRLPQLFSEYAQRRGIRSVTTVNAGHSSATTSDWVSTYLAQDLVTPPNLYVLRWGLNDAISNQDTFFTKLAQGLATIRASYTPAQMSVIVMAPNDTDDTPNNRDAAWAQRINWRISQIARQYQAAFIDTYHYYPNAVQANDWMDRPFLATVNAGSFVTGTTYTISSVGTTDFTAIGASQNVVGTIFIAGGAGSGTGQATDSRHIHPEAVMNTWIVERIAAMVFDPMLPLAENPVKNIPGADTTKAVTELPGTYPKGLSIYKCDGSAWPQDGNVITFGSADGVWFQINHSYTAGYGSPFATRFGTVALGWKDWNNYSDLPSLDVTAGTGFAQPGTSENMRVQGSSGGQISTIIGRGYLVKSAPGPVAANTVIATIPDARWRPANTPAWAIQLAAWDGSAWEYITGTVATNGQISTNTATALNTSRIYFGPAFWCVQG